jgi:hypothetical protein
MPREKLVSDFPDVVPESSLPTETTWDKGKLAKKKVRVDYYLTLQTAS